MSKSVYVCVYVGGGGRGVHDFELLRYVQFSSSLCINV